MLVANESQWTIPEALTNWSCADRTRDSVYFAICDLQPCTAKQVAEHLGWPINRVTGRITELQTKYQIIEVFDEIQGDSRKERRYCDKIKR